MNKMIRMAVGLILLAVLAACASQAAPQKKKAPQQIIPTVYVINPKTSYSSQIEGYLTPTPFLPGGSTTKGSGSRPWGKYDGPTIWPPIDIPFPVGILAQPQNQENILLMGDDQREDASFRTDSIMLLTLKPNEGTASVISFPRDLYVYVPGWTMQRLNVIMERGGFDLMATTFEYNFGVRPKYYAQVNLFTMAKIIDALGGIDVNVPVALKDPTYGIDVPAGMVHMDGHTAELYVQARYTTSDFDRSRRQQETLQALFIRLISLDAVSRAGELYSTYQTEVKTNVALEDITRWLPFASQLQDFSRIKRYSIGEAEVVPWTVPTSGTDVFLPEKNAVMRLIKQALSVN